MKRLALIAIFSLVSCGIADADQAIYKISGVLPAGSSTHPQILDGESFTFSARVDLEAREDDNGSDGFYDAVINSTLTFSGGFEAEVGGLVVAVSDNDFGFDGVGFHSQGNISFICSVVTTDLNSLDSDQLPRLGTIVEHFFPINVPTVALRFSDELGAVEVDAMNVESVFAVEPLPFVPDTLIRFTGEMPPNSTNASNYIFPGETFTATFLASSSFPNTATSETFSVFSNSVVCGEIVFSGGRRIQLPTKNLAVAVIDESTTSNDGIIVYEQSASIRTYFSSRNIDNSLVDSLEFPTAPFQLTQDTPTGALSGSSYAFFFYDIDDGNRALGFRGQDAIDMDVSIEHAPRIPFSFDVVQGQYVGGGIDGLFSSDDFDLSGRRSATDVVSRYHVEFEGVSAVAIPTTMEFSMESSVFARTDVGLKIDFYNFQNEAWEELYTGTAARFSDSVVTVQANGDLSRFVEADSLTIRTRARFGSEIARQSFAANIDQVLWVTQ